MVVVEAVEEEAVPSDPVRTVVRVARVALARGRQAARRLPRIVAQVAVALALVVLAEPRLSAVEAPRVVSF